MSFILLLVLENFQTFYLKTLFSVYIRAAKEKALHWPSTRVVAVATATTASNPKWPLKEDTPHPVTVVAAAMAAAVAAWLGTPVTAFMATLTLTTEEVVMETWKRRKATTTTRINRQRLSRIWQMLMVRKWWWIFDWTLLANHCDHR